MMAIISDLNISYSIQLILENHENIEKRKYTYFHRRLDATHIFALYFTVIDDAKTASNFNVSYSL